MENLVKCSINSFYKGKRVLVTGHTGFKGGWLSLWLHLLGAELAGFSKEIPTVPSFFEATQLDKFLLDFRGDISNYNSIEECLNRFKPSVIFHLAAQPLVIQSYHSPLFTIKSNINGTANLLEACRYCSSVKSVVIITSDKCYDNDESGRSFAENDKMGGKDLYSASKGCAELIVNAYRNSFFNPDKYGSDHFVSIATARSGNVIGGGDWGLYRLFPDCVRSLSENKEIVIRNPQSVRPWQFVLDPLYGYLKLGQLLYSEGLRYSGAWNFGPSKENIIKVIDLVETLIKYWGRGSYRTENYAIDEAKTLILNTEKANNQLAWIPYYNFENSVIQSAKWYMHFYNHPKSDMLEISLNQIKDFMHNIQE